MTDLQREFNRKYGAYKGLITRWRGQGYDITDTYTPPQKITKGSLRRLEKAKEEIQRQKDVQEARAYVKAREAFDLINGLIKGYADGTILGHVGQFDYIGHGGKGDGASLKRGSQNDLEIELRRAYEKAKKSPEKMLTFAKNVDDNIDWLEEVIEKYILAVYRKKTAQWSADAASRWGEYLRLLGAFKSALNRGL